jgi:DNA-3-methyladenine glycosylase
MIRAFDAHPTRRLRRGELPADTTALARYLIGKSLVHDHPGQRLVGRIVETEAYVVGDAAGHAYRGPTPRNRSLFLQRGHAYVYFVYGCWYALNVSGETPGVGAGVLLRALEPIEGVPQMQHNRDRKLVELPHAAPAGWPAMDIDRRFDGAIPVRQESALAGNRNTTGRGGSQSVRIGAHERNRHAVWGSSNTTMRLSQAGPGRLRV